LSHGQQAATQHYKQEKPTAANDGAGVKMRHLKKHAVSDDDCVAIQYTQAVKVFGKWPKKIPAYAGIHCKEIF